MQTPLAMSQTTDDEGVYENPDPESTGIYQDLNESTKEGESEYQSLGEDKASPCGLKKSGAEKSGGGGGGAVAATSSNDESIPSEETEYEVSMPVNASLAHPRPGKSATSNDHSGQGANQQPAYQNVKRFNRRV